MWRRKWRERNADKRVCKRKDPAWLREGAIVRSKRQARENEDGENLIARWWCDSLAIKRGDNARRLPRSPFGGPTLGVSSRVCHRRNRPFLHSRFARLPFNSYPRSVVSRFASRKRTHNRPFLANVRETLNSALRKIGSPVPNVDDYSTGDSAFDKAHSRFVLYLPRELAL